MREKGAGTVDVDKAKEEAYVEHCKQVDTNQRVPRCYSYYNGEGKAEPGSLAITAAAVGTKYRVHAQETLEPYIFD